MPIDLAYKTGTEAVGSTEHSCGNDTTTLAVLTDVGLYQLFLDVNDMVAGDQLRIRVYEKVRSGDTQRVGHEWVLNDAQSSKIWISEELKLGIGFDFSITALVGTITILWSIRRVS